MMSRINKLFLALAVLTVFGLAAPTIKADACTTIAGNLVTNCGFETGTFAGWTRSGNLGFTSVIPGAANSGAFGASFGPVGSLGFISQNIATVAGASYDVHFHLRSPGGTPNQFTFSWDGVVINNQINAAAFPYTSFTFTVVATGVLTDLRFGFRQDPDFWDFDDVAVTLSGAEIPEPATMILLGSGLVGVAVKARRRRRAL